MTGACARNGCSNTGTIRVELHDQRIPYSVWCCWTHHGELIRTDQCRIGGCRDRAVRLGRCAQHQATEEVHLPVRDQILRVLCPTNDAGAAEPLAGGLTFTDLCERIPVNRTTVARALNVLKEEHLVIRTGEAGTRDGRWYATGAPEPSEVRAARHALEEALRALGAPSEPQTAPVSLLATRVAEASARRDDQLRELHAALDQRTDELDEAIERISAVESQMASLAAAKAELEGGYRAGYRDGHRDGVGSRTIG